MLVLRYFGYVGGSLLALLLVCNAVFTKPALPDVLSSNPEQPAIRIHSDKKWPERVVFDTSMAPVVAPAAIAQAAAEASPKAEAPSITAKARVREAFAQFTPAEPKRDAKADLKAQAQPKRKVATRVAKVHVGRPLVLASQQPRFGWFDNTW